MIGGCAAMDMGVAISGADATLLLLLLLMLLPLLLLLGVYGSTFEAELFGEIGLNEASGLGEGGGDVEDESALLLMLLLAGGALLAAADSDMSVIAGGGAAAVAKRALGVSETGGRSSSGSGSKGTITGAGEGVGAYVDGASLRDGFDAVRCTILGGAGDCVESREGGGAGAALKGALGLCVASLAEGGTEEYAGLLSGDLAVWLEGDRWSKFDDSGGCVNRGGGVLMRGAGDIERCGTGGGARAGGGVVAAKIITLTYTYKYSTHTRTSACTHKHIRTRAHSHVHAHARSHTLTITRIRTRAHVPGCLPCMAGGVPRRVMGDSERVAAPPPAAPAGLPAIVPARRPGGGVPSTSAVGLVG